MCRRKLLPVIFLVVGMLIVTSFVDLAFAIDEAMLLKPRPCILNHQRNRPQKPQLSNLRASQCSASNKGRWSSMTLGGTTSLL